MTKIVFISTAHRDQREANTSHGSILFGRAARNDVRPSDDLQEQHAPVGGGGVVGADPAEDELVFAADELRGVRPEGSQDAAGGAEGIPGFDASSMR